MVLLIRRVKRLSHERSCWAISSRECWYSETWTGFGKADVYLLWKRVEIPDITGPEKLKDESASAYRMIQTDPFGERKFPITGELMGSREYLWYTFKLKETPDRFVLASHIVNTLGYAGNQQISQKSLINSCRSNLLAISKICSLKGNFYQI